MKQIAIHLLFPLFFLPFIAFSQTWEFSQKMGNSDQEGNDFLGISAAISDSFMLAGAWWEDNGIPIQNESGAAYLYKRSSNGKWIEVQKLVSPTPESLGYFGFRVEMEGKVALIAAQNEDENGVQNAGVVYAYHLTNDDTLVMEDRLVADDGQGGDVFGSAIALTKGYALIGSFENSYDENGQNFLDRAGAAYLFKREPNQTWTQIRKLVAPDRTEDANFGKYLDIDNQGLVIGAFNLDFGTSPLRAGAVYGAYCNDSLLIWGYDDVTSADLVKFNAADPSGLGFFGWDVAISGRWAVIGKSGEANLPDGGIRGSTGAAYFFHWENNSWVEKQKVYASDYHQSGQFGRAIGIDDRICVIGAGTSFENVAGGDTVFGAGAAYIFELQNNNEWKEVQKLAGTQRGNNDLYGEAVDVSGQFIVISAWSADSLPDTTILGGGALYLYERNGILEPLSINELREFSSIKLLENPSSTGVLKILNTTTPFEASILVTGTTGQTLVSTETTLQTNLEIDLSHLASGVYWIQVRREGYIPQIFKWIHP